MMSNDVRTLLEMMVRSHDYYESQWHNPDNYEEQREANRAACSAIYQLIGDVCQRFHLGFNAEKCGLKCTIYIGGEKMN